MTLSKTALTAFFIFQIATSAMAADDTFLGIFAGDKVLGHGDCEIVAAEMSVSTRFGQPKNFSAKDMQNVRQFSSNMLITLFEDMENRVRESGYNAAVNVTIELSQSTDFVYESGQNWRNGDNSFDAEAIVVGWIYGDLVTAECKPR